jgi:hypothetical protein
MAESEERKKYRRDWARAHKAKGTAAARQWRIAHPERSKELAREYRERNKEAVAARNAAWQRAHPDKVKNNNLRRLGWTLQAFNEALAVQGFCCAICKTDLRLLPQKQVHADHCHLSGLRRGVLCHHCNTGLGAFRDETSLLSAARLYLLEKR